MKTYDDYLQHTRKIADVNYSLALLQWDQEVNMPPKGAEARGRQMATLSGIAHQLSSDTAYGHLLRELAENDTLTPEQQKNVQLSLKDFSRQEKYTPSFVERLSLATSKGFNDWATARKNNDFSLFKDALEELVQLKQEEAELIGYQAHPYNALMEEYEPGATVAMIDELFLGVRSQLGQLLQTVRSKNAPPNVLEGKKFDKDKQWPLGIALLRQMGYDFEAGRQDLAPHPFCTNFGAKDVRVTTRVNEDDVFDMLSSCIHEGGHALYEQGLLEENYGLPSGTYISLGIHESQSRLWENQVGRSWPYWQANYAMIQQSFPEQLGHIDAFDVYRAINLVSPSLIRVQADELTYHFHIMIRYELEKQLIAGDLKVKDLPKAWNEMYRQYLGVEVPGDAQGVLQDIHWSHGSFGYFATYSLGSFYAAQFFHQAQQEIPALEDHIRQGNLLPLKQWLNHKIHRHGRLFTAEELCRQVTGSPLQYQYFHDYLTQKIESVYG